MKRLLILLGLVILGCVPILQEPNVLVEDVTVAGKTTVRLAQGEDTTLLYESNSVNDSLIHAFMKWMAYGTVGSGGAEYFWVWHTEDGTYLWTQVQTSDESGGGDTAATITMTGTYVADPGITYDSTIAYRLVASGYVWSGSETDTGYISIPWCEQKADTFVLDAQGQLIIDWSMTITGSGGILDTLKWHLIRGYQVDLCDKIDTFWLIWTATVDTSVLYVGGGLSKYIDYANDTLTLTLQDTARAAADTVDYVVGKDDDGTIVYHKNTDIAFGQDTIPQVILKFPFVETP